MKRDHVEVRVQRQVMAKLRDVVDINACERCMCVTVLLSKSNVCVCSMT